MPKEAKSFKKFASKHLAGVIETRRKTAVAKKEKKERLERRQKREKKAADQEEQEHVDQLKRLEELDPSFYQYLEEEEPTLLQYTENEVDVSGSDTGTESDEDQESPEKVELQDNRITQAFLKKTISEKKFDVLLQIFISGIKEVGFNYSKSGAHMELLKFSDPELVKPALKDISTFFANNVGSLLKDGSFKNAKARYITRRFLAAMVAAIDEGSSDTQLAIVLTRNLQPFVSVLHMIKGQTKTVLKLVLKLCSSEDDQLRLVAYVIVRSIANRATGTNTLYQSAAFKGIFLALIRAAGNYNIHTLPTIGNLMSCVTDLYGTDMEAAYQHVFTHIRELALYLRNALQKQTQPNLRAVFNWQYLTALRTCGLIVSSYPAPAQLGPLVFPVVQIALGVMDLFSSPRMFPASLIIIEMLNHISNRVHGLYIPLATYILRILQAPSIQLDEKRAVKDERDTTDLQFTMRVKKSQQHSYNYRISLWKEALYLLTEHLAACSFNIGFPECFWVVETTLRKLRVNCKAIQISNLIKTLLTHLENTNKQILKKRNNVTFGPCDTVNVKMFEDQLRSEGTSLMKYHQQIRQQRILNLANKQKSIKESVVLEDAATVPMKKRRVERS